MNDYPTNKRQEEFDVNDSSNRRRRKTDIAQPLDYVTKELVSEFVADKQRTTPPPKSIFQKLFKMG